MNHINILDDMDETDSMPHLTKLIEWSKSQFLVHIRWGELNSHDYFVEINCAGEKQIVMRDYWAPLNETRSKDELIDKCAETLLEQIENKKTIQMLKTVFGKILN